MSAELDASLLAACRVLAGEGLTDAFGHLSARLDDGHLRITPRIGPGLVRSAEQLLTITPERDVVAGDPALVPGEIVLHTSTLAQRPDVGAVCRFHGSAVAAWSALNRPLPPVISVALAFGGDVPVFDTALTVTQPETADKVAALLGDGTAIILRGFGAVTTGATVGEAIVRATLLERAARAALSAAAAGEPLAYTREQAVAFTSRTAVVAEQISRAWTYLQEHHPPREFK